MSSHKPLNFFGLTALVLLGAVSELLGKPVGGAAASGADAAAPKRLFKTVFLTAIAVLALLGIGGLLFMASGLYNMAADQPHTPPVRWMLLAGRTRSVEFYSRGIASPDLSNPTLARDGFVFYRKLCQPCHGGPGVANDQVGRGINPKPPPLTTTAVNWTDAQLYWIISHGLKLSGMPGFAPPLGDRDRWALIAFLRRLPLVSPADYQLMASSPGQPSLPADAPSDADLGFPSIQKGNPRLGKTLISQYGCATCHLIPGGGSGLVGPPLTGFAERQYIAGILVNTPANVVAFITDPQALKPHTAMPNVGVQRTEAIDIAAYLYTLGSPNRLAALRRAGTRARNGSERAGR
ncbi:MAG TPA: c-type cytochrome [Bryobacteraceae bacterium]|nr:c-type cytochrome [Bryobacteraceae bacterium]